MKNTKESKNKTAKNLIVNQLEYMVNKSKIEKVFLKGKKCMSLEGSKEKPKVGNSELLFNVKLEGFHKFYVITNDKEKWEEKGFLEEDIEL